ncbi:MAG: hypothetical protein U0R64_01800 [Candidatus Nanopelagicales bacterium]
MSVRIRPGDEPVWTADAGTDDTVPDPHDVRGVFDTPRPQQRVMWRPEWTRYVAGGLLGLFALVVLGVLAYRLSLPAPPAATSAAPPTLPSAAPTTPSDALTATPTATPTVRDVMAMPWQGAALPVSDTAGPRQFTDRRSTGFSHDPQGAALAAVHISTHIDPYTGPRVFTPTIEEQVVGGEGLVAQTTEAYRQAAHRAGLADDAVERGDPVLAPTGEMTGWRIGHYRADAVTTVELLVTTPQGQQVVYEVPVRWSGDDWQVVLADGPAESLFRVTAAHDPDSFELFIDKGE